jgi:hypothetical protein
MFYYTFYSYARNSTTATIPSGLFDSINTSQGTNFSYMFLSTFSSYAYNSTTATIPPGLFDSINTSLSTNSSNMFSNTFSNYARNSTTATIPPGLFDSINTSQGTLFNYMFSNTFYYYARRQAQFVANGSVVSALTQSFTNPYSVKVGVSGTPSSNPTIAAGDSIYPTYNAAVRTITKPTGAYASYSWYYKDGTSCNVTNPTQDCGLQNAGNQVTFPNTSYWTPDTSTEFGSVTFYSLNLTPVVTAISPDQGLTNETGQVITITGANFTGATAVTVGGQACAPFTVNSDTEITCTLPVFGTAGAKDVLITTPNGTNLANGLYVVGAQQTPPHSPGAVVLAPPSTGRHN